MSTNSKIGILNDDGTVTAIRCHWYGYLPYCGRMLHEHYTDEKKVRELVSLGYLSSLGPEIGVKYDEPAFRELSMSVMSARCVELRESVRKQCTFYGRDMKRPEYKAVTYDSIGEFLLNGESHNYVFVKGVWWCDELEGQRDMSSPWCTVKQALEEYDRESES